MKGFTYGGVMRSNFGLGLVLVIVGMGTLALQGLAYPANGGEGWWSLSPVAGGGVVCVRTFVDAGGARRMRWLW